jgi:nucleotide-binding universal stress UspA family protein
MVLSPFRPGSSTPGRDAPSGTGGGSFRRVLVPVDTSGCSTAALALAITICHQVGGSLRVVHVRMWDRPVPRSPGRFYTETSEQATAFLESALSCAWEHAIEASGVVVDAERSRMGKAILGEASAWSAEVIVVAQREPKLFGGGVWDKVSRQVADGATCAVVLAGRSPS